MVRRRVTSGRIIIAAIIVLAMVVAIAPFIHMISLSLSSSGAIVTGRVGLLPVELTFETYGEVLSDLSTLRSIYVTILITVVYTAMSMVMTVAGAYPLSKQRQP